MKTSAPGCACGLVPVLLSLLAVLHITTTQKNDIDIYSLTVDSKVSSRFAHTVVTSRVVNRADVTQEATFQVELPKRAFITNFSMIIDGVTYPGNIKEKASAQEEYSAAVARGESAGLVKATGRKMEQFQVSVNVAPSAKVTFELVYEELLKRHLGAYELLLKVQPQQLVKHLQMDIHIFEPQGISLLETESTFMTNELAHALTISQNETKAHIRFKPTLSQQKSPGGEDTVVNGNFIIHYDVNRTLSGGSIQIENGYFVHYFAPEGLPTIPKNVIFVIDKSGSMSGKKIQQTREALIKILDDLSPRDQFNLISFSREATQWKPSLVPASAENVNQARSYVSHLQAQGGTNINGAMMTAVQLLTNANRQELLPAGSVSLIILLTDGDPTVGETNPAKIQKNVQEAIADQYSLFCLGFGFDVSYAFLEKLALDNGGLARRIYEDSDSALQLEVPKCPRRCMGAAPVPSRFCVGALGSPRPSRLLSRPDPSFQHMQNITFQMESSVAEKEGEFQSPKYIFHSFMERLWAYLTIQQLLEKMISASDAEKQALETRALNLSLQYSFVTPLTSMVVTKPEGKEQSEVAEKPVETENKHRHFQFGPPLARFHTTGDRRFRLTGSSYPDSVRLEGNTYRGPAGSYWKITGNPGRIGPQGPLDSPSSRLTYHGFRESLLPDMLLAPSIPDEVFHSTGLRTKARATDTPTTVTQRHRKRKPSGSSMDSSQPAKTDSPPAPIQAPPVILTLPGQSVNRLCVDIKHSQGPMTLLSDPDQGIEVRGQYETEKAQFSWIEVTFKNPQLQVRASPEHVVVTRNRRNSAYKWKGTLFSVIPGLSMTMDKAGLLLLSSPDKVTIGLLPWDGPGKGLRLLLQDTDRFSSHVGGTLGQFYQDVLWGPPAAADDSRRTLSVQGHDYSATRLLKLDYQEGLPGTEISCWSVEL
ncbi:inter-alpha-trypsin inhibitor heavy chain H4 [Suricata suricatta]|uniref:inter-alpha-trypsin inhibitor heavy chain H4 n=1 Tax=Suricata suricatta TaxID=37032 RepID=UPI0011556EE9|nr:inter-alpha-trypsin inhibitor heavy chain H4 [Suricata suricatta]